MKFDPLERRRGLNFAEASRHARDLWGEYGVVDLNYDSPVDRRYQVGTRGAPVGKRARGYGSDWVEAFEDAAKRGLS